MTDEKPGVFVEALLDEPSKQRLHDFVTKTLNISPAITPDKYHATLAYSKKWFHYTPSDHVNGATLFPESWEVFGSDQKVLVLKVNAPVLKERNDQLKAAGAISDFPDYKIHVTVAPVEAGFDPSSFHLPPFNLTVTHEVGKPLDPNFVYDPKSMSESVAGSILKDVLSDGDDSSKK